MGHFDTTVTAIGKNQQDAIDTAIAQFLYEEGHRHSIYYEDTKAEFLRKVPPKKRVEKEMWERSLYGRRRSVYVTFEEDPAAPESEWLEEWRITIHSHA